MRHCQRRPLCSRRWWEFPKCLARRTLYYESTRRGCSSCWGSVNGAGCVKLARGWLEGGLNSSPVALAGCLERIKRNYVRHTGDVKWKENWKEEKPFSLLLCYNRTRQTFLSLLLLSYAVGIWQWHFYLTTYVSEHSFFLSPNLQARRRVFISLLLRKCFVSFSKLCFNCEPIRAIVYHKVQADSNEKLVMRETWKIIGNRAQGNFILKRDALCRYSLLLVQISNLV